MEEDFLGAATLLDSVLEELRWGLAWWDDSVSHEMWELDSLVVAVLNIVAVLLVMLVEICKWGTGEIAEWIWDSVNLMVLLWLTVLEWDAMSCVGAGGCVVGAGRVGCGCGCGGVEKVE
jgi:hypothetical protein